ncbi:putative reverse transcriptase domain-containing protein, partial [Tanacetum coccineum]
MDREVKRLKRSRIPLIKVRWNSKRGPEFTWEREDQFRKKYPHLFAKTAPSSSAALDINALALSDRHPTYHETPSDQMTKKPFPYSNEREKDLLGIIHTDVCGPLRHVSRQGASYFITFTDDYSRYGYVYLLKHKHE